jgi:type IV secretory pathway VirB4 component
MSAKAALLVEELVEEELANLQASIEQMKQTPELQRRIKAFGECQRTEDETSSQFYDKLRHWLNRDIPVTKSPLHPPRQG